MKRLIGRNQGNSQEFGVEVRFESADTHVLSVFGLVQVVPRSATIEEVLAAGLTPKGQVERRVRHEEREARDVSSAGDLLAGKSLARASRWISFEPDHVNLDNLAFAASTSLNNRCENSDDRDHASSGKVGCGKSCFSV